jgi:di/tricarboxylate transporter
VGFAASKSDFHLGFASLFAAFIFGVFALGLSTDEVISKFPTRFFLTLVSVTLLFAIAESNGTLEVIAERAITLCQGRVRLIPPIMFFFTFVISALGVGNIAATALIAPSAMVLARRLNLNAFLMTLIIVGGANAASLSPFSLTGILLFELTMKVAPEVELEAIKSSLIQVFIFSSLIISSIHLIGFLVCGGISWWRQPNSTQIKSSSEVKISSLNVSQKVTLLALFGFACGIFMGNSHFLTGFFGAKWQEVGSQLSAIALCLIVALMLTGLVKIEKAIARIPWSTIALLTGVITYLAVLEHGGMIVWVSDLIQSNAVINNNAAILAFGSSMLSSISSSSGVVIPLFVPMARVLEPQYTSAIYLIATIAVSAHLVDCSPFSTLGALCLASARKEEVGGHKHLFRNLIIWSLAMIPTAVTFFWTFAP